MTPTRPSRRPFYIVLALVVLAGLGLSLFGDNLVETIRRLHDV